MFSILSETDILYIFNIISEPFSRYDQWESDMRRILDGTADLTQMVEETSKFFNCGIAVNDNQLQRVYGSENMEIIRRQSPLAARK